MYNTFREACFAKGFLGSDQEFIGALRKANSWGIAHYLRKLFVKLLFTNTMDIPEYVWQQTWQWRGQMILNSIIENKVILYIPNKILLPIIMMFITILITGV